MFLRKIRYDNGSDLNLYYAPLLYVIKAQMIQWYEWTKHILLNFYLFSFTPAQFALAPVSQVSHRPKKQEITFSNEVFTLLYIAKCIVWT